MKILYMGIYRNTEYPGIELCHEYHLAGYGYFTKDPISKILSFIAGEIAHSAEPKARLRVEEQGYFLHMYGRPQGICGTIISDDEYPYLAAQQILEKICDEFVSKYPLTALANAEANTLPFPELKGYIEKYQDPGQADSIAKIQRELNETKNVLHKTIEEVLQRGEKIDDLVAKSDGLSAQSKMFYTQAKKQNSCCIVM